MSNAKGETNGRTRIDVCLHSLPAPKHARRPTQAVWPKVKNDQMSHDAYTCHKHAGAVPFPTKRNGDYQHVGQVFNE